MVAVLYGGLTLVFAILFTLFSNNFDAIKLTKYQLIEMNVSTFLLLFLFGFVRGYLLQQNLWDTITIIALFYLIWYYLKTVIANSVNRDGNIIRGLSMQ